MTRKNQSLQFPGEGSADKRFKRGTLLMLQHEKKEMFNALEGAGGEPSDAELAQDMGAMLGTGVYRAGIDVSGAQLTAQQSWRGQGRTESVAGYKTVIHEMKNTNLKYKPRKGTKGGEEEKVEVDGLDGVLTAEERKQFDAVMAGELRGGY